MRLDNQEFIRVYDELADALFRYCYYRVFDREKARDTVQETFTRVWEYLVKGNEIDNLKAFLYRTARNLIIDQSRKKTTESLEMLQEQGFEPSYDNTEAIHNLIDAKDAAALLKELGPIYREVVTLRYINDFNPKEIAQIIGETDNVVSVRINRGINMLREILKSHDHQQD